MKVRRMPSTPPKRPASKTTLSRGEAWPEAEGSGAGGPAAVQSSRAKTKAAKSTSRVSSRSRSRVEVPGLNDVVQGSTWATSSRPRVRASSSLRCLPDEPRKMRGLSMCSSVTQGGNQPGRTHQGAGERAPQNAVHGERDHHRRDSREPPAFEPQPSQRWHHREQRGKAEEQQRVADRLV